LRSDETSGTVLDMISFALEPRIIESRTPARLVALYDDDVAEFSRQIDRHGFH
jgi:hypothetical protein